MFRSRSRTTSESSDAGVDQHQAPPPNSTNQESVPQGARPIPGHSTANTMAGSGSSYLSSSADSYISQSPSQGGGFLSGVMGNRTNAGQELVAYDLDGKFTYNQVLKSQFGAKINKITVDENGKFGYFSSDMRPVPPGWYDLDKSKYKVPMGWYDKTKN